jgi:hypothetical protein
MSSLNATESDHIACNGADEAADKGSTSDEQGTRNRLIATIVVVFGWLWFSIAIILWWWHLSSPSDELMSYCSDNSV